MDTDLNSNEWWRGSDHRWHRNDRHPDSFAQNPAASGFPINDSTHVADGFIYTTVMRENIDRYRGVVIVGAIILGVTPFLQWAQFRLRSDKPAEAFTFFSVDRYLVFPVGAVCVAVVGLFLAFTFQKRLRRIALFTAMFELLFNVAGWVVAAVVIAKPVAVKTSGSLWPAAILDISHPGWAAWIGFCACITLLGIGFMHWQETLTLRGPAVGVVDIDASPVVLEDEVEFHLPSIRDTLRDE